MPSYSLKPFLYLSALLSLGLAVSACSASPDDVIEPAETIETSSSDQPLAPSASATGLRDVVMNDLSGVFTKVGDDSPVILIVPGSGPTDRDGNNPLGVKAASYQLLADGLAETGIASLRVDKRGMFGSAAAGDPNAVTLSIYAQDYLDWAGWLREETGRDCVYLLGHSEGGQMVAAAAAQNKQGICGLILVASPGRPIFEVLREQLRANPANAPILPQAMAAIDQLETGNRVDSSELHPGLRPLFAEPVQDFMISSYGVDPAQLIREAALPTLILHPERDIQVSVDDANRLASAGGELVIVDGANHVLKSAPEARAGNLATYANPDLPLAEGVVSSIVYFVERTGG